MAVNVGSAEGYLDLNISRFLTKLNTAQSAASSMAAKTTMTTNQKLAGVGKGFTSVGKILTKTVTLPIVGVGAAAIAVTSKFDSAMSKVSAVSGATGKNLESLRDKAKEMGAKTKFSATESAEAFNYMAMAGWKTEDMLNGIEGIMNLAAASGEDLATTSDIVTDALTAFGLTAKDSGHFADVLAANASNANTNVSMLGESFKYVAPVAGALGYSVEDVNLALGLMANSGIKASQAGTTLRGALTRLAKPTGEVQGVMKKYGISLTDTKGNMLPLRDVMGQLREKFSTLSKAEQAQAATTLFGKNAMSGMLAIINSSEKDWNKLANAIDNADGTAEKMAGTMLDNLGGQLTLLKSALEGLAIRIGEVLMPTIRKIVQWIQNFVDKLNKMDDATLRNIIKIAGLVAAVGPLLTIFGKFLTFYTSIPSKISAVTGAFGTLKTGVLNIGEAFKLHQTGLTATAMQTSKLGSGLSVLKGAFVATTGPIWAIIAVIVVLVAAFITLWKTNEKFRNAIKGIWNEVKNTFSEFGQSIVETLNMAGFKFENFREVVAKVVDVLKKVWIEFCNILAPLFVGVFKIIAKHIEIITKTISGAFRVIVGLFKGDGEMIKSGVKTIGEGIKAIFIGIPKAVLNALKGVLDVILGWFGTSTGEIWDGFKNIVNGIVTFFKELPGKVITFFKELPEKILTIMQTLPEKIKGFFDKVNEKIKTTFETLPDKITDALKVLPGKIVDFLTSIPKKIKEFFSGKGKTESEKGGEEVAIAVKDGAEKKVKNINWGTVIKNILLGIGKFIIQFISLGAQIVWALIKGIGSVIGTLLSSIGSLIMQLLVKFGMFVVDVAKKGLEAGMQFLTNLVSSIAQLPNKLVYWFGYAIGEVTLFIINMVNKAKEVGTNFVNNIINFIKQLPSKMWNFLNNVISKATIFVNNMANKAKQAGSKFLNNVVNGIKSLPSKFARIISSIISKAASFVRSMANKAKQAATNFKNGIISGLSSLPGKMASIGADIARGIWNGISGLKDWVISKVKAMGSSILNGLKAALRIKSPSQVFADEVGKNITLGIGKGIADTDAVQETINAGVSVVQRSWTAIKTAFGKNIDDLQMQTRDGFKSAWNEMLAAQNDVIAKAKKANKVYNNGVKADRKAANKYAKQIYLDYLNSHIKGLSKLKVNSKKWTVLVKKNSKVRQNAVKAEKKAVKIALKQQQKLTAEYNKQVNTIKNNLTKDINTVMSKYTNAVAEERNKLFSAMNPFSAFESTTKNTTSSILANAKAQVDAMQEWNAEMENIQNKIKGQSWASQFMEDLRSAGYDSLADVKVLGEMTNAQWDEFIKLQSQKYAAANVQARQTIDIAPYQTEIKKLMTQATTDLNNLYNAYAKNMKKYGKTVKNNSVVVGKNLINGIKSGIKTNQPALFKYIDSLCSNLVKNTKKALKIKSPSKVFSDEVGQWIPTGITEGVKNAMPKAENDMQDAINDISLNFDSFDNKVNLSKFINSFKEVFGEFGKWFVTFENKFVEGIQTMTNSLTELSYTISAMPLTEGGYIPTGGFNSNSTGGFKQGGAGNIMNNGGDTFVFNSPKMIDEIEAARQVKKVKKDMAEGF